MTPIADRQGLRVRPGVAAVVKSLALLGTVTALPVSDIILTFERESRERQVKDNAAAAWFRWDGIQRCVASDLYTTPGANLFAIAQIVGGIAGEHSRGDDAAVRHALSAYTPHIPASSPAEIDYHWSKALGVRHDAALPEITTAFRRLALVVHPDKGGTREQWDEVMTAFEQARLEAKPPPVQAEWELPDLAAEEAIWSSLFPDQEAQDEAS